MRFQNVKNVVSMPDVLKMYGYGMNGAGFMVCPFHKEKTASLKIYPKSFYCFGCGASGDVITFVQKIEKITAYEALNKLEVMFGIKPPEELNRAEKQKLVHNETEKKVSESLNKWQAEIEELFYKFFRLCDIGKRNIKHRNFEMACRFYDKAFYYLDCIENDFMAFYQVIHKDIKKIKQYVEIMEWGEIANEL